MEPPYQTPCAWRPEVDIRGDGGYFVAPPSIHATGHTYRWEILRVAGTIWPSTTSRERYRPKAEQPKLDIRGIAEGIPDGERDTLLYKEACRLRGKNLDKAEAWAVIKEFAANCDPPFPEAEARKKLEQAWKFPAGDAPGREVSERPRAISATSLFEICSERIETRPIAEGFIDEEEKIIFHGEGGCKKSLLTLNMAAVIASGQPLLWDKFRVHRPLNFLFVQSENGRKSLNERARKMVRGNPALAKGFEHIFFAGIDGGVELAGSVTEKSFREDIYESAKAAGVPIDVINFDPLISYHEGDENDNSRMRTTLDWISEIAFNVGGDPVVVHHDNRRALSAARVRLQTGRGTRSTFS